MKHVIPLMQREWLQHRFAWSLMLLLPVAIALLATSVGQIMIDEPDLPAELPIGLALGSLAGGVGVTFTVVALSSLILMSGLARRDHGDRSVEFWMSLPTSHSASLAVPLLVHLLLLPAVALGVGLVAGVLVSLPVLARTVGFDAWLALPWPQLMAAALAIVGRILAGLPLALLWLSPLVLALVLLGAWVGRWGFVILGVGVGLGSGVLDKLLGQPWPALLLGRWLEGAGRSLAGATDFEHSALHGADFSGPGEVLGLVPALATQDLMAAVARLASPALLLGLVIAAACFWGLVRWRRAGA